MRASEYRSRFSEISGGPTMEKHHHISEDNQTTKLPMFHTTNYANQGVGADEQGAEMVTELQLREHSGLSHHFTHTREKAMQHKLLSEWPVESGPANEAA